MSQIILDCDLMRFPHSGLYYYCLNLGLHVNQLLALEEQEFVKMYIPPAVFPAFGPSSVHIVESKWHKYRFFRDFMKDCRVWHAPFQSGRVMPDKKHNKDMKVLLTVHDLNPLHEGQPKKQQEKAIQHTQSLIDKSDALVCVSEFTKNDVLRYCDVKNKPVHMIYNGVSIDNVSVDSPEAYRPSRPFLFGMGYVNAKKNYHVLLSLLTQNSDLELVIAGKLAEKNYVSAILQKAAEAGVADRLHILGPVSDADKVWYLCNCMAFVHPSLAEGFGLPVVEAMLFGKPVFLSDKTSLPEIAGDLGFYFSNFEENHMQKVFQEGMARYRNVNMEAALKERGKRFNWERSAAEYIKVYQSLY
jgi:glycosyltransferase involved in cell wall biosynthesis